MIIVNADNSIYLTRGDDVVFDVGATIEGEAFTFNAGDSVHFIVSEKKNCGAVVLDKTFPVTTDSESVSIRLTSNETKIGDTINKPTDYWYDIELIDRLGNVQTIVGYDEDGAKIFRLFPEGDLEGGRE